MTARNHTVPSAESPFGAVRQWLAEADALGRLNPRAMALATVGLEGRPAVRMVLLKGLSVQEGYIIFYTNYRSRKAHELERDARAAAAVYWEELGRQIRFEGQVLRSPVEESDAYFATRPFRSQLNAWVSAQSALLNDPDELERRAQTLALEYAGERPGPVPRPTFWGGYRLWCDSVELWTEGRNRFHHRIRYQRDLLPDAERGFLGGPWRAERLQP